ncbi:MAG: hypothetical protein CL862_01775 [Cyanobium sp. NAT70]|nr:hypothetical protein [Cyanobium sp. NAT70]
MCDVDRQRHVCVVSSPGLLPARAVPLARLRRGGRRAPRRPAVRGARAPAHGARARGRRVRVRRRRRAGVRCVPLQHDALGAHRTERGRRGARARGVRGPGARALARRPAGRVPGDV